MTLVPINMSKRMRFLLTCALAACAALIGIAVLLVRTGPASLGQGSASALYVPQTDTSEIDLTWNESTAPNYVLSLGAAEVQDDAPEAGSITYSSLDNLGRAGRAVGLLTHQTVVDAEERGRLEMPGVEPSGWRDNDRCSIELPDGTTYNGYFWNRSHLIADSLGGLPEEQNLITGTRTQNVGSNDGTGGMAYAETRAREWLFADSGDGTLYYAVTPVYVGNELVCRAVVVDIRSSDEALDERVVVYNAAKGYTINYATGEWHAL